MNLGAIEPQGRVLFPVSLVEGVLGLCSAVLVPLHFDAVEERGRWTAAPLAAYFVSLGCLQVSIMNEGAPWWSKLATTFHPAGSNIFLPIFYNLF